MPTLTEITLRNLKPPQKGQITHFDDSVPGFGVRISQGGTRTFVLVHGRQRERRTLGRYPIISLSDARTEAKRVLAERTLHAHRLPTIKFKDALELFFSTHCDKRNRASTSKETKRLLNKHFLPALREETLEDITPQHIARVVDRLLPTPGECNHAFTAVRTFFRWTVRRHYLRHSPCEGMQLPTRLNKKDRVLTDAELSAVYKVARTEGYPYGSIVLLLMLTGQRRGEIAGLHADYLDRKDKTVTLPPAVVKNNRAHTYPVGRMAQGVLKTLASQGLLFPARGAPDRAFSGWSKCKRQLDKRCKIAPWTLHDLRRTMATNLAAMDVPPHVVERLLNHSSGTISGVAAIYNRHQYMDEMRAALSKWEAHLRRVAGR